MIIPGVYRGISAVGIHVCRDSIVGASPGGMIKVWDLANPCPYNASEWEEVEGDGEEDYDEEAKMEYPFWRNNVTGDVQQEEPSGAGEFSI